MRFRTTLSLGALLLLLFTLAAWSSPAVAHPSTNLLLRASDTQSISGKIMSVGDAEFSVDTSKSQKPEPVRFLMDGNTKIEGTLSVGAQAMVEYRAEQGKNIAVRVVVTPTSAIAPY